MQELNNSKFFSGRAISILLSVCIKHTLLWDSVLVLDIKLRWQQGMVYLHKSVFQSHGYLSSANCYVDREWSTCTSRCSSHTVTCPAPTVTWTGNGLPAQVGVPVARLPVQRQLLRGQGMVYLHKSVFQSHGYLSSANCYVDRERSTCTSRCSSLMVTCPAPTVTWTIAGFSRSLGSHCMPSGWKTTEKR